MLKAFINGYVSLFRYIAVILLLLCAGSLICFSFVWPLWYAATNFAGIYTIIALVFFAVLIISAFTKNIVTSLRRCQNPQQKKQLVKRTCLVWGFRLTIIACVAGIFVSVLNGKKAAAVIFLVSGFILYGIYAATVKSRRNEQD